MKKYCMDCGKEIFGRLAIRCVQCYHKTRTGENHPMWKGGPNKCIDCGKVLSGYRSNRCFKCAMQKMGTDRKGETNPNYSRGEYTTPHYCIDCGDPLSRPFTKRCKSCSEHLKHLGSSNPAWAGGTSLSKFYINFTRKLKLHIRERDHFTCQECGKTEGRLGRILHVHHIDYDKANYDEDNLISLCHSCHTKTLFNRSYWIRRFIQKIFVTRETKENKIKQKGVI